MTKKRLSYVGTLLLISVLVFLPLSAPMAKPNITFIKIVDENTTIPDGTKLQELGSAAFDGNNIVFSGVNTEATVPASNGIYTVSKGKIKVIADHNNAIPGDTGNFQTLENPRVRTNDVIFMGGISPKFGIYEASKGTLKVIVDENTAIPRGSGNFSSISSQSFNDKSVVFSGGGDSSQRGIYKATAGTIEVIADNTIDLPADTLFGASSVDNDVVFSTRNLETGDPSIYLANGGNLEVLVDSSTAIPNTPNVKKFSSISNLSLGVVK